VLENNMAEVTASLIKDLRERTGAGMADCKKALQETEADIEKAIDFLRKKGLAKAAKKAGREATEGAIISYIHGGGRIGVLLEVNCETDFVARGDDFQGFCREVALQIAAMNPQVVSSDEVGADAIAREKDVRLAQAKESGKPDAVIQKVVDGQISKWLKEIALLDQPWVKDDKKTISVLTQELISKIGENIKIRRFSRYELGEGLEKKKDDFAAEVAKTAGLA
jgi:elongation factor Ts